MSLTNRKLVIMAKAPRPGSVKTRLAKTRLAKTRLAKTLPLPAVTELYLCLLNDTIALAHLLDRVDVALMCPAYDVEDLSRAVAQAVRIVPQTGQGLTAGLTSVFAHFTYPGHQRVIAFNSDSPHLPASALESAFDLLETRDLVVGPTHDGGYYLVGAKAPHPGLFSNDGLGTANALQALFTRARALKLSIDLTDPFYDIDEASDLSQLADELQRVPGKAPRTAKWLSEWASARTNKEFL